MPFRNTEHRYGHLAIFLHWVMAVIVIALLALGLWMVRLPMSLQKLKFFGWHKEYGIMVLMLVCVRLGWRVGNVVPRMPAHIAQFQKFAAHAMHYVLYFLLVAMPLTGWMISSAAGLPVSFFGWFVLPDLVAPSDNLMEWLELIHEWLGYACVAAITLHASAALQHHFYHKDDILRRMLP